MPTVSSIPGLKETLNQMRRLLDVKSVRVHSVRPYDDKSYVVLVNVTAQKHSWMVASLEGHIQIGAHRRITETETGYTILFTFIPKMSTDEIIARARKLGAKGTAKTTFIGGRMCDALVYKDEIIEVRASKDSQALEIVRVANDNPVIDVADDGRVYRAHGERILLARHLLEMAC